MSENKSDKRITKDIINRLGSLKSILELPLKNDTKRDLITKYTNYIQRITDQLAISND